MKQHDVVLTCTVHEDTPTLEESSCTSRDCSPALCSQTDSFCCVSLNLIPLACEGERWGRKEGRIRGERAGERTDQRKRTLYLRYIGLINEITSQGHFPVMTAMCTYMAD